MEMVIATSADAADWARLRAALFPEDSEQDHRIEVDEALASADPAALVLLARAPSGEAIGFAEATLRRDYVNGCDSTPVVFLEAIYVAPGHRRAGVARRLCDRIAVWARGQGCGEFASDALLDNEESHAFHIAAGFAETERVVYFRRALESAPHG